MPTPDRSAIRRRLALGAAVLIVVVVAVIALANRPEAPEAPQAPPQAVAPKTSPLAIDTKPLPLPAPPLSRGALLDAAALAASAYAAGQPAPEANAALVGQRFRVSLPFGCSGPASEPDPAATAFWTLDERRRSIRLVARPEVWSETAWVRTLAGDKPFDAIEGFWLPRPWTRSEACPPDADQARGGPGERTLGLAMFFEPGSSRVGQRGSRPYEHVTIVPDGGQPIAPHGFRLTLAGRVMAFDDGQPVRCHSEGPNKRPICLISVAFEDVTFEDPATGQTLAQWRIN